MSITKKITLDNESLLYYQADNDGVYRAVRYRVISEDRNRFSHWSPIYRIDYPVVTKLTGVQNVHANAIGSNPKTITITWNVPSPTIYSNTETFDVFLQWKSSTSTVTIPWFYAATVTAKTFSVLVPASNPSHLDVQIQLPSAAKLKNDKLALFEMISHNV